MKYYVLATFFALSAPVDASDDWMSDIKNKMKNYVPNSESYPIPDVKNGFHKIKGKLKRKFSPHAKKKSLTYPEDMMFLSDWKDNYSRPFQVAMVEYKLAWEAQDAAIKNNNKKRDSLSEESVRKTTETIENAKEKYLEAKSKIKTKLYIDEKVHDWNNAEEYNWKEENNDEEYNWQKGNDDQGMDFQNQGEYEFI